MRDAARNKRMRTTLAIDDDVLAAARHLSYREGRSLGEVISALARQGLRRDVDNPVLRNGLPLLPRKAGVPPVTLELVNQLRDELA
jgi:hypothetical protein